MYTSKISLILVLVFLFVLAETTSIKIWCKQHFEGFDVSDTYNPNLPPTQNVAVEDFHVLNQIEEVDDRKQEIQITLFQMYLWNDPRIKVNTSHEYWKGHGAKTRKSIRLSGDFVDKCLWTPKLQFRGTVGMSLSNPHSTSTSHTSFQTYLLSDSTIKISSFNMKLSISCNLNFDKYPFDEQNCIIGRVLLSPLYHIGEDVHWAINGKLDFTSRLFSKKDGKFRQRELQYHLFHPYEVSDQKNITIGDFKVPMFAWTIRMKRILLPFIVKSFVPTILLVVVSWTSFIIDPECVPGRAGVLVTLLLVLSTVSLHELDESPSEQGVTPLLIWNHICLMMICLALLEYSVILFAMRFNKENKKTRSILKRAGSGSRRIRDLNMTKMKSSITYIDRSSEQRKNSENSLNDEHSKRYSCKAYQVDQCSLCIFPIIFFFVLSIYTIYYAKS